MSKKTAVAAAFAVVAVAAAFFAGARKAQAQAPAAAKSPMELLWEDRDTMVYFLQHEGHSCFVATTRGGAGITISCPK